jgi:hypothetical protein
LNLETPSFKDVLLPLGHKHRLERLLVVVAEGSADAFQHGLNSFSFPLWIVSQLGMAKKTKKSATRF